MSKHPMRLCIVIQGVSAEELFAVGPNDLRDYFLPEHLDVNPADVQQVSFRQTIETDSSGLPARERVHLDNFYKAAAPNKENQ